MKKSIVISATTGLSQAQLTTIVERLLAYGQAEMNAILEDAGNHSDEEVAEAQLATALDFEVIQDGHALVTVSAGVAEVCAIEGLSIAVFDHDVPSEPVPSAFRELAAAMNVPVTHRPKGCGNCATCSC